MMSLEDAFLRSLVAVPLIAMLLMFGTCESMCNSVGYTLGTSVVGPDYPGSEPDTKFDELPWKCAGFRRKASGKWGYSGQYDHAACREIRDNCNSKEPNGWMCDQWESIQEGKIGWGNDNITGKNWISPTAKIVSVETLTGEPKKTKKKRRRRRRRATPPKTSKPPKNQASPRAWHPPLAIANAPPILRNPSPIRNPLITQLERAMKDYDKEAMEAAFTLATDSIIASAEAGLRDKVLADSADLIKVLKRNDMSFEGKQQSIREMERAIERLKRRLNKKDGG